jgi:prepilin-type N-terminal cleavage/methylation domain-containing protein
MNPNPSSKSAARSAAGFTLTELLVVIVIIAILASIGFPIANKMLSRAADNKCVSQLRSWSNTIALYASENAGKVECKKWNSIGTNDHSLYLPYIASDGTHESGYRLLETMRCCPALKGDAAKASNGNLLTAYTMTDPTPSSDNAKEVGYNLSTIKNPSRFLIMVEAMGGQASIKTAAQIASRVKPLTREPNVRHKGEVVNAIMGDYSVRSFNESDIERYAVSWTTF